jgi:hypothetical protein
VTSWQKPTKYNTCFFAVVVLQLILLLKEEKATKNRSSSITPKTSVLFKWKKKNTAFWKKGFVLLQNEKLLFSQKSKTTTTTLSTRLILRKNAGLYFNLEVMASRLFAQSSRVPFWKDQLACGWYKLSMVMVLRLGAKCLRPDRMRLSM